MTSFKRRGAGFVHRRGLRPRAQSELRRGVFPKEAIAELVKCMEDYRDDLVVILAGYEREMQDFIDVNPGLASRISYRFHFEDFTTDQLIEIFMRELDSTGFTAGEGIEAELSELFDYFRNFKSFGNGRFAREVLQKAIISHANRIAESVASAQEGDVVIECCDIPDRRAMLDALNAEDVSADALLGDLIGLEHPKGERSSSSNASSRSASARDAQG